MMAALIKVCYAIMLVAATILIVGFVVFFLAVMFRGIFSY